MRSNTARTAIVLLSFLLTATAMVAKGEQKFERERKFKRLTDVQIYELTAPGDAMMARLKIELKLKRGSVQWILTDPTGEERMTGTAASGRAVGNTGKLKAIPGVWRLEIRLDLASGNFSIDWVAR